MQLGLSRFKQTMDRAFQKTPPNNLSH